MSAEMEAADSRGKFGFLAERPVGAAAADAAELRGVCSPGGSFSLVFLGAMLVGRISSQECGDRSVAERHGGLCSEELCRVELESACRA